MVANRLWRCCDDVWSLSSFSRMAETLWCPFPDCRCPIASISLPSNRISACKAPIKSRTLWTLVTFAWLAEDKGIRAVEAVALLDKDIIRRACEMSACCPWKVCSIWTCASPAIDQIRTCVSAHSWSWKVRALTCTLISPAGVNFSLHQWEAHWHMCIWGGSTIGKEVECNFLYLSHSWHGHPLGHYKIESFTFSWAKLSNTYIHKKSLLENLYESSTLLCRHLILKFSPSQ